MSEYSKKPLPVELQPELLKSRGLNIKNDDDATQNLLNLSYYRLSGYWYIMLEDKAKHRFKPDSFFESAIQIYHFDSQLRGITFKAIESIEIVLRTKLSYYFSVFQDNKNWYEEPKNYKQRFNLSKFLGQLDEEVNRSQEEFIVHHKSKYGYSEQNRMPTWKALEVLSFGKLSKMFGSLDPSSNFISSENEKLNQENNTQFKTTKQILKEIIESFGLYHHNLLKSWLQALVDVRNICGHHNRLWNRRFMNIPQILRPNSPNWITIFPEEHDKDKLYIILCCIQYLIQATKSKSSFKEELFELLQSAPFVDQRAMGFPVDWQTDPFWLPSSSDA